MTLYYTLCFYLLVLEIFIFFVLVAPLPYVARRKLIQFITTNAAIEQLKYGFNVSAVFVAVLFIDTASRLMRETEQRRLRKEGKLGPEYLYGNTQNETTKLFYSQRNLYLTGMTLLFLAIKNCVYAFLKENVALEGKTHELEAQLATLRSAHVDLTPATTTSKSGGGPPEPPSAPTKSATEKKTD